MRSELTDLVFKAKRPKLKILTGDEIALRSYALEITFMRACPIPFMLREFIVQHRTKINSNNAKYTYVYVHWLEREFIT